MLLDFSILHRLTFYLFFFIVIFIWPNSIIFKNDDYLLGVEFIYTIGTAILIHLHFAFFPEEEIHDNVISYVCFLSGWLREFYFFVKLLEYVNKSIAIKFLFCLVALASSILNLHIFGLVLDGVAV